MGPWWARRSTATTATASTSGPPRARVVEAEPGRSFVFECSMFDFHFSTWGYRIEPTETGCRVTEWSDDLRPESAMEFSKQTSGIARPDRAQPPDDQRHPRPTGRRRRTLIRLSEPSTSRADAGHDLDRARAARRTRWSRSARSVASAAAEA